MGKRKKRCFSYSAGERGRNRVRVYEEKSGGPVFLEYYDREAPSLPLRRRRKSLGRISRESAKRIADETASRFTESAEPALKQLTLGELFDNYLRTVTPRKGRRTQDRKDTLLDGSASGRHVNSVG